MRKWIWFLKLKIFIASGVVPENSSMAGDLLHIALDICEGLNSHILANNEASLLINSQMCMLLSQRLLQARETLQPVHHALGMTGPSPFALDVLLPMQELVHVLLKAQKTVIEDCSAGTKWMESALRQGGDFKETFGEILYDLQWLCSILRKQVGQDRQVLELADCDGTLCETEVDTLLTAAKKDEEDLQNLLRESQAGHSCSVEGCSRESTCMPYLASQLLKKLEFQALPAAEKKEYYAGLQKCKLGKLSAWPFVVSVNMPNLGAGRKLGQGGFGIVHEAEWLGKPYAIKISRHGYQEFFKREIAALSGLHHPHIMHLVCCAEEKKRCSYIMELMDKTLSEMLENSELSLVRRVDVLLQIAEGIKYLHSMNLVHRDLKPENILVKCVHPSSEHPMEALWEEGPLCIAKVSDFGTTKLKMESTANQTSCIGTTMFMAPEAYRPEHADTQPERIHPKKLDVYSFGLICFCVLIGEPTPFPPTEFINATGRPPLKERVREGQRPQLPEYCPKSLSTLIEQCWDANPVNRPDFQTICTELRYIKGCLLTGLYDNLYDDDLSLASALARLAPNLIQGHEEVEKWFRRFEESSLGLMVSKFHHEAQLDETSDSN